MIELMKRWLIYLFQTCGIYLIWIIIHYSASHLYIEWCVPKTITGFLLSPLIAPMPHCCILRWAINQGGENINIMWMFISLYIIRIANPP